MRHLIFALLLAVGMGGLALTVARLVRFMWVGRPGIPVDRIPERLGSVVLYWLFQRKVMEKLRERQYQRWRAELSRRELAEMDEIGMQLAYQNLSQGSESGL